MDTWMYIVLGVVAVIVILLLVILIRTLMFVPKKNIEADTEEIEFDKERATKNLQKLITFRTVSDLDSSKEDDKEFEGLINELPKLYPLFIKTCPLTRFDGRGLLFKWEGKDHSSASILMSHYDVVSVNEEEWSKPAFEGIIEDGVLWGRGALDTKITLNSALTAAEHLLEKGFVPEKDIYFAFSGGEEINGPGAIYIANYFKENNIKIDMIVDEGGAVVKDVFPGVKEACGLIGIAEKGLLNVEYECKSSGGHASAPKPHTPVGMLSSACVKVENHPFKFQITKPVAEMFDTLGRRSTFAYRMIFSNLWAFSWLLNKICKKKGGELNALTRTTVAFTMMEGSQGRNVIPPKATMISNIRLNPFDTMESATKYLKKTINDDNIEIKVLEGDNPSTISQTDCDGYRRVAKAVASTWKGCLVSPYLMVQCSDSRRYSDICDKVYRFSAMDLTSEERATIHGNNERVRLETLYRSVEFYIRLIRQC